MSKPARTAGLKQDREPDLGSDAHRHHHVLEGRVIRNREQGGTVSIREFQFDHVLIHIAQGIDQVGDIETNFDAVTSVVDIEFVNRFFLLCVVGSDTQGSRFDIQTDPFELLARQDGGALQRCQQRQTAYGDPILLSGRG